MKKTRYSDSQIIKGIKRGRRGPHDQSGLPRMRHCRSDILQLEE